MFVNGALFILQRPLYGSSSKNRQTLASPRNNVTRLKGRAARLGPVAPALNDTTNLLLVQSKLLTDLLIAQVRSQLQNLKMTRRWLRKSPAATSPQNKTGLLSPDRERSRANLMLKRYLFTGLDISFVISQSLSDSRLRFIRVNLCDFICQCHVQ